MVAGATRTQSVEEIHALISKLQGELASAKGKISRLEHEKANAQHNVQTLQKVLETDTSRIDSQYREEIGQLKGQIQEQTEIIEERDNAIANLVNQSLSSAEQNAEYQRLEKENSGFAKQLLDQEEELRRKNQMVDLLRGQLDQRDKQLSERNGQLNDLQQKIKQLQAGQEQSQRICRVQKLKQEGEATLKSELARVRATLVVKERMIQQMEEAQRQQAPATRTTETKGDWARQRKFLEAEVDELREENESKRAALLDLRRKVWDAKETTSQVDGLKMKLSNAQAALKKQELVEQETSQKIRETQIALQKQLEVAESQNKTLLEEQRQLRQSSEEAIQKSQRKMGAELKAAVANNKTLEERYQQLKDMRKMETETVQELETAVKGLKQESIRSKDHALKLEAEMASLHEQISDRSAELNVARNTIEKLEADLKASAAKKQKEFTTQLDKMKSELQTLAEENEIMKKQNEFMSLARKKLSSQVDQVSDRSAELKTSRSETETLKCELGACIAAYEELKSTTESSVQFLTERNESMWKQNEKLYAKNEELTSHVGSLTSQLETLKQRNESIKKQNEQISSSKEPTSHILETSDRSTELETAQRKTGGSDLEVSMAAYERRKRTCESPALSLADWNRYTKNRKEKLSLDKAELRAQLGKMESELKTLSAEYASIKKQNEKLSSMNGELTSQMDKISDRSAELETARRRIKTLEADLEVSMASYKELKHATETSVKSVTEQNESMRKQNEKISLENEELKAKADNIADRLAELMTARRKIESLESALEACKAGQEELKRTTETSVQSLKEQNESMNKQKEVLSSNKEELTAQVDKMKSELETMSRKHQTRIEELEAELESMSRRNSQGDKMKSELETMSRMHKTRIEELEAELESMSRRSQEVVEFHEREIKSLQNELKEAKKAREESEKLIVSSYEKQVVSLNKEKDEAVDALRNDLTAYRSKRAEEVAELSGQVTSMKEENETLQTHHYNELQAKNQHIFALEHTLHAQEKTVETMKTEMDQLQASMHSATNNRRAEVEDLQKEIMDMRSNLSRQERENVDMKMKLDEARLTHSAEVAKLQEKLDDQERDSPLAKTLADLHNDERMLMVKERLETLKARNAELKEENVNLTAKLERVMVKINSLKDYKTRIEELELEQRRVIEELETECNGLKKRVHELQRSVEIRQSGSTLAADKNRQKEMKDKKSGPLKGLFRKRGPSCTNVDATLLIEESEDEFEEKKLEEAVMYI